MKNVWLSVREGYEQRDAGCWGGLEVAGIGKFKGTTAYRETWFLMCGGRGPASVYRTSVDA